MFVNKYYSNNFIESPDVLKHFNSKLQRFPLTELVDDLRKSFSKKEKVTIKTYQSQD